MGGCGRWSGKHHGFTVAEVIVATFPAERARRGPALEDQVVALLESLAVVHGIRVRPPALHADAAHEATQDAAARDEIGHRDLLGHLDRVVLDREDVAEEEQLRTSRGAREDGRRHVRGHVHARRCRVVLVDHQALEPDLIGQLVLVEVALIVRRRRLGREGRRQDKGPVDGTCVLSTSHPPPAPPPPRYRSPHPRPCHDTRATVGALQHHLRVEPG
jgi:hypothetical protein